MREVKWNKRMAKHCIVTLTNPFDSLKQPAKGSLNQTIYGELGRTMNEQLKALIASRGNGSTGSPQDGSTPLTTSGEKP